MDSEKLIEQLLEKYWNCETSLEEEKQLREYFSGKELPRQWKEAELFQYYQQQRKAGLSDVNFDHEVLKKIKANEPRGKSVKMFVYVARIAAGLIVVAVATFLVRQEIRKEYPPEIVDTYSDPKLALEETKKAFMMISKSFGKAQKEVNSINLLNEAEKKIGEKKVEKQAERSI